MLKKLATILIFCSAALSFAQVKPSFQAFGADYLKLGEASRGYHPFEVKVNFAPWAFVARGNVKAPQGDPDLLFNSMDNDQLYVMVAYAPAPVSGSDGLEYQAGIYDITLFYSDGEDEFQSVIKDLNISLLPPIAGDSWATGSLQDAQGKRGTPGSVFKNKEFANAIFQASAQPLSKAQAKAAVKAAEDRKKQALIAQRDSIAAAQKAAEKRKQDSILSAEEKRKRIQQEQLRQQQMRQQQQQQYPQQQYQQYPQQYPQQQQYQQRPQQYPQQQQYQQRPQQVAPAAPSDPCDQPGMSPLQKKRCRMSK